MPPEKLEGDVYMQIRESIKKVSLALEEFSVTTSEAVDELNHYFGGCGLTLTFRIASNNFRKLHGYPMRRKYRWKNRQQKLSSII